MRTTRALLLPVLLLLLCITLLPPPGAHTQEGARGLAVGGNAGAKAAPFHALVTGEESFKDFGEEREHHKRG